MYTAKSKLKEKYLKCLNGSLKQGDNLTIAMDVLIKNNSRAQIKKKKENAYS